MNSMNPIRLILWIQGLKRRNLLSQNIPQESPHPDGVGIKFGFQSTMIPFRTNTAGFLKGGPHSQL